MNATATRGERQGGGRRTAPRADIQLRSFKAPTMAEAVAQVKAALGRDAIIMHTRSYQVRTMLGLRRREVVEITAADGANVRKVSGANSHLARIAPITQSPHPAASSAAAAYRPIGPRLARPDAAPALLTSAGIPPAAARTAGAGEVGGVLASPAAVTAAMVSLSNDVTALKNMVKDLVLATRRQRIPDMHEDLFDHYLQLVQSEVAEEIATDIVQTIQKQVRPERFTDDLYINERIAEQLERIIPTAGPIERTKTSGPHVVALIGPTGVGKTTTIAKLAANLKLRDRRRVGLITLDTYRIAAVDQLRRYAGIIRAPLKVVVGPDELRDAIEAMNEMEYILIDTAGRSPNDALKLSELKATLDAARPDEVHLVLSTTANQESAEMAVSRFGEVRVDKIIFTKVDEAAHLGMVLNVVRKVNKSLSYITTGQDVPDHIEVGKGKRLAQLILGKTG